MRISMKAVAAVTFMAVLYPLHESRASPAALPAEAFARLPAIEHPRISPDGDKLAYFRLLDGEPTLIIQGLDGSGLVTVPAGQNFRYLWVEWANNDRLVFSIGFAAARRTVETQETRLAAIDSDGSDFAFIVKPDTEVPVGSRVASRELAPPQIQDDIVSWLPDEPHHILVAVDGNHDARSEVRRIDIRDGDYSIVQGGRRGIQHWEVDREHVIAAGWGYDLTGFRISLRGSDGEWHDSADLAWAAAGNTPGAFAADRRYLYVFGPSEAGLQALKMVDLETQEITETVFSHPEVDVSSLLLAPDGDRAIGVAYTHHEPEVHYFDDEYGVLQMSLDRVLKETTNRIVSASEDRQKIILAASGDTQPTIYYLWDRAKGQIAIVAETRPGLTAEILSPMEPVTYEARDGVEIPAYLTRPGNASGDEPLPAVVLPHGGPHVRTSRDFDYLRQFLASRGYAVFEPNFRGSGGYGETWRAAGEQQWGGLMQDDVTDGALWLVEAGIADPERLCIVGGSYGGYAAMMGAIRTPDLFRCAVSINGALDLPHLIMEARNYIGGREWTKSIGLSDEKAAAVSPHDRADEIDIPVLVVQTADDRVVPPDQAQRFVDRLRGLDKDVRFEWIDAGGHDLYDADARLRLLEALENFLAATIGAD